MEPMCTDYNNTVTIMTECEQDVNIKRFVHQDPTGAN